MAPVIELQNLDVKLGGRTILDHLNGSISGQCIGLLGPNGSGKSTLINTLLGFYPPAAGTARIFGEDIQGNIKRLRAMIGYMPESDAFIADMSGVRFVRYMAELSGLPPSEAMERAHEAFFHVGLGEARYRKVGTYSLGMKQLAKLAQALVHGPKLVLLDEPTNGLDPEARQRMLQLGGGAYGANPAHELQARFPGRYFSESHGRQAGAGERKRQWPSINALTKPMRAR